MARIGLEFISDIDMYLFIKKEIRGAIFLKLLKGLNMK